jgi:4-methyl-5(b-hydroxyethyl)-thiazole monophosphate biosynthesis
MKILLFLASGFEMMEMSVFVDIFGWARTDFGIDIDVVTCGFHKQVTSTFGVTVAVDKLMDEIIVDEYAALAFPGGFEEYGFYQEAYDERFLNLIRMFNVKHKAMASVCVAALPLGKSGVLENKKATTYPLMDGKRQNQLRGFGVQVVQQPIVVDDNIITSYGPQTAPGVAFQLLEILTSKEKADAVKAAMCFQLNND